MKEARFTSVEDVARAISVVHTELVLIHPFREGNGRVARLLATLMALQAGLPPLDFGGLKGKTRKDYFAAIRVGLDRNYKAMQEIFSGVILKTLRGSVGTRQYLQVPGRKGWGSFGLFVIIALDRVAMR